MRVFKITNVCVQVWGILIVPSLTAAPVAESSPLPRRPPAARSQHLPHTKVVGKSKQGVKEQGVSKNGQGGNGDAPPPYCDCAVASQPHVHSAPVRYPHILSVGTIPQRRASEFRCHTHHTHTPLQRQVAREKEKAAGKHPKPWQADNQRAPPPPHITQ